MTTKPLHMTTEQVSKVTKLVSLLTDEEFGNLLQIADDYSSLSDEAEKHQRLMGLVLICLSYITSHLDKLNDQ